MVIRKNIGIIFLLLAFSLTACSAFNNGKFSQDLLPGKVSGEVLFEDDFSKSGSGLETISNVYELKAYSSDGYLISVNQADSRAITTTNLNFSNSEISVKAKKILGPSDSQMGLICRYQDKYNFYAFTISSDGYAGIIRIKEGQKELLNSETLIRAENINLADGENQLSALCDGGKLALTINGELILTAEDDSFINGDAGFFVETFDLAKTTVLFNDFVIRKP